MIFGKERPVDLKGVFSSAAVLWSNLPSECPKNGYLSCGQAEMVFSGHLLKLFDVKTNPSAPRRINVAAYSRSDGHNRGVARVFAEAEGTTVSFQIISTGGEEKRIRRLRVERQFPDGTPDIIVVKDGRRDGFVIAAFNELAGLRRKEMKETEKDLLCGGCSAKVNGLPGSVV